MKTKTKLKNEVEARQTVAQQLGKTELLVENAAYDTMYSNCEKNRTVLYVLRKDVSPGMHLIVFWADILREWLELKVRSGYKLDTNAAATIAKMRVKPEDRYAAQPEKLKARFQRKIARANKAEREAAKREGREPNLTKRVVTKDVDPVTNIKLGTRKYEMAKVLLSSKDPKKVRKDMETLILGFIKERPNATYEKIGLERYTNQLIRWTATDGSVRKEVFVEILTALGLA